MSRSKIKCASCKKRIPDHEPDIVLRDLNNGGRPRYYHTRCGEAAYTTAAESPSLYRLTVRHIEGVAN